MVAKLGRPKHPLAGKETVGSTELTKIGKKITYDKIGKMIGISRFTVREIAVGQSRPSRAVQLDLQRELGIAPKMWEELPTERQGISDSDICRRDLDSSASDVDADSPSIVVVKSDISLVETYRIMERELSTDLNRARKAGVPIRDLSSLMQARLKIVQQIGKLTGELEITEAQVLRSPAFREVIEVVKEMARRFPDAGRHLAEKFAEFDVPKSQKGKKKGVEKS